MRPRNLALLADRGIVRVAGADAEKLLQGLITNDMERVREGAAIHAALLSPQGKILFEFFVAGTEGEFLLETAAAEAANLAKRLSLYKLRANVEIGEVSGQYAVFVLWGDATAGSVAPAGATAFIDPRLAELGVRMIAPRESQSALLAATGARPAPADDWHGHRIALGVPEAGLDYQLGDTFLHEANYDQLNGVSFSKGCFIGQEVASRMQHRGGGRKRVVIVEGAGALAANAPITAGSVTLGSIGSVDGSRALALLRLDRAAEALAKGIVISAEAVPVSLSKPGWAQFDLAPPARTEAP
jgi:folate-binding protein YgfZ